MIIENNIINSTSTMYEEYDSEDEFESNHSDEFIYDKNYSRLTQELLNIKYEFIWKEGVVYFGFLIKRKGTFEFYKSQQLSHTYLYVDNVKEFVIFDKIDNISYKYCMKENIPLIIENINSITNTNKSIFIIFPNHPKILKNSNEIMSKHFKDNLNKNNNLLSIDSIYRCIYIPNLNIVNFQKLTSAIYLNVNLRKIKKEEILIKEENEYNKNINEEIKDFESNFKLYTDISHILKFSNILDFDLINKNNNIITNNENYFQIKSISVTSNHLIFKKPSLHSSSRFLRNYFENDNFIKIVFIDKNLEELIKHIYNSGIIINDRKYIFFLITSNNIKSGSFWMIDLNYSDNIKSISQIYSELGMNQMNNLSFPKKLARISQNFTGTKEYKNDQKIIINNIEDITNNSEFIFSDGCGKISKDLMIKICEKLNKSELSSAIQIRYRGAKGVLLVDNNLINEIHFTNSMIKFNLENPNFDNLEIVRFSDYSQGHINLQILILLIVNGVKKNHILKLVKNQIKLIENNKIDKNIINRIYSEMRIKDSDFSSFSKSALSAYFYNKLSHLMTKFRLKIKHSAFLIGVFDFNNLLKEDEIFVQIKKSKKKKIIKGKCVITKNPCLSVYDLQKVYCVDIPAYHHLVNVIVFPHRGEIPLAFKISNSDLDGDVFFVTWDKHLTKIKNRNFEDKLEIPISIKKYEQDYSISLQDNMINYFNFFQSNNKLGIINSLYLEHSNHLLRGNNFTYDNSFLTELISSLNSIEVDFCKSGICSILDDQYKYLNKLNQGTPTFLKKGIQQKNLNYFYFLLDEIYQSKLEKNEFVKICLNKMENSDNNNTSQNSFNFYNKKYLKLYEYKNYDKIEYSTLFKIYDSINISNNFHKTFYYSILTSTEEYFYINIKSNQNLISQFLSNLNNDIKIIQKVKNLYQSYSNKIKSIMNEFDILFESELIYLTYLKSPLNKQIDEDEWKKSIKLEKENLNNFILKSIDDIIVEYNITKEEIKSILFFITYWKKGEKIKLSENQKINLELELELYDYEIKSIKDFMEDLLEHKNYNSMKNYYLENLKVISLFEYYFN